MIFRITQKLAKKIKAVPVAALPSHVLLAMGLSREEADCTLRISLGRENSEKEVRKAVGLIIEAAVRLQQEIG